MPSAGRRVTRSGIAKQLYCLFGLRRMTTAPAGATAGLTGCSSLLASILLQQPTAALNAPAFGAGGGGHIEVLELSLLDSWNVRGGLMMGDVVVQRRAADSCGEVGWTAGGRAGRLLRRLLRTEARGGTQGGVVVGGLR